MKTKYKIFNTVTLNIIDNFEQDIRLHAYRRVLFPMMSQLRSVNIWLGRYP
jgi:hypothetical protein